MELIHSTNALDEAGRLSAVARSGLLDPNTDEAYRPITTLVRSVFDAPIAFVSSIDATRQRYKCAFGVGVTDLPRETTFCNDVLRTSDIVVIEDAPHDPRYRAHELVVGPMAIRSYLGAPLISPDGFVVGTVCVADVKPRRFADHEVTIIRQFADVVLDQSELLQIADHDSLTGAWTRRAFLQAVSREMARARRYGEPASIALFDLDHFKRINDGFGHRVGDLVLRTAVSACQARMREEETIGRLGGEEFAVLFVGTGLSAATAAAERLRLGMEAARVLERPGLGFTSSFGVAELNSAMERPEDWIEAADRALYRAKANGRNRIETA